MDQIDRDSDDVGDTTERDPDQLLDGSESAPSAPEVATELGAHRYLLAAFFALGLIGAYVLSRALGATWASLANRDWFVRALPRMAAANEDTQGLWSTALASLVALVTLVRVYRRPSVRAWAEGVVVELAKCVWPTRRDVTNYTTVVIVVSLICTAYLTVLDRLYAFVTGLVYGGGS
jgi:preprotein translocase subunit SecE